MLAFPRDVRLVTYPSGHVAHEPPRPLCFRFVSTQLDGSKHHCVVLSFYEKLTIREILQVVETKIAKLQNAIKILVQSGKLDQACPLCDDRDAIMVEKLEILAEIAKENNDTDAHSRLRAQKDSLLVLLQHRFASREAMAPQFNGVSPAMWGPKAIMVLSKFPFYGLLEMFVKCIYRISRFGTPVPLERFIANFMYEVPVPPCGQIRVRWAVGEEVMTFSRAAPNKLPDAHSSFRLLFRVLDLPTIICIWSAMLTEQRLVFASSSLGLLSHVTGALMQLLFPFQWQGGTTS